MPSNSSNMTAPSLIVSSAINAAMAKLTHGSHRLASLVQSLFEGELDLIGDVHGEIEALDSLLINLGYTLDGIHPQGRRLVFLGDLVDRGPDTPAVLARVLPMLANGRAQAVLGNHEFNLLRNRPNHGNLWFYGQSDSDPAMPQQCLAAELRDPVRAWVRSLPVALEREELRVVHAAWVDQAVEQARNHVDAWALYQEAERQIAKELVRCPEVDEVEANLRHQNNNPIKALTSGLEHRSQQALTIWGRRRLETRTPWWNDYDSPVFCVIGHYSRVNTVGKDNRTLFGDQDPWRTLGQGQVMCIDWSAGYRCLERAHPGAPRRSALAALRWPQRQLMLDDGRVLSMAAPVPAISHELPASAPAPAVGTIQSACE